MHLPTLRQENRLRRRGFRLIAGLDEAGRGSWAGPLVAGAVILDPAKKIPGVRDSKLLRPIQRQSLFEVITQNVLGWSVGIVSAATIDEIGLGPANRLAFEIAVANLDVPPDYLLIDALPLPTVPIPSASIVGADRSITSVAAASIVAKVYRDRLMHEFAKRYPRYGFHRHKGYGTALHHQMIRRYGICDLHRKSFRPVKHFLAA
ncbi:MAG: ribonuclease HII [Candidatus Buchananbacteria bacterium RIFCSPLOWO2_01_FULL_56_15]|uniref:Ribonuclease HII n=2 Tax=Candidatus Buchananiibacteriota TaxID=1817903 RepID=A0A1G1YLT1_9BACT|nr:MAG: ribonuclease HII [Candidatus Buchananbacteria bacterium RIFCSPHIGHO2_02_FULL_56_16]OGY54683.1 MAG: ribonuclease HII [Candidatus Buchananbacteria bacterium RIFCSPLOWO2_01_FULL_56_15]